MRTLSFLLILIGFATSAQSKGELTEIKWTEPVSFSTPGETFIALHFEKAQYEWSETKLPGFYDQRSIPGTPETVEINLTNLSFEPLSAAERALVANMSIGNEVLYEGSVNYIRKKAFARLKLIPVRKNPNSGALEKLVSFSWNATPQGNISARRARNNSWANNSVLASGEWYRVGVVKTGMFKLTPAFLNDLGINTASLDPRTLKVYGNGGGELPALNSAFRHDDLVENAIFVQGESDGSMDGNDFALFYAEGPNEWEYDYESDRFRHQRNNYADTNYYYITFGGGNGKRVSNVASAPGAPTHNVTTFIDYAQHENDWTNLVGSGRQWFGEYFDVTPSYNFTFDFPNLDNSEPIWINARAVARAPGSTNMSITPNSSSSSLTLSFNAVNPSPSADYVAASERSGSFSNTLANNVILTATYLDNGLPGSIAWLDYLEINVTRQLIHSGSLTSFRDPRVIGSGNVVAYALGNAQNATVWDITNPLSPQRVQGQLQGSTFTFSSSGDTLREYLSFSGTSFPTPAAYGKVENQNLHGEPVSELVIVSPGKFLSEADRLAQFHRDHDNMTVKVVTPQEIYNEFSSGKQDISAIRDYMRMYYERAAGGSDLPNHLLLFGDCSYDYKDILTTNTNLVPTFQSGASFSLYQSFCSDDYFGNLDPNEGEFIFADATDLSIGRLPVKTNLEAAQVVDKILAYHNESSLGDWTQKVLFVADDVDVFWETVLMTDADGLANRLDQDYPDLNIEKIYTDSYVQQSSSGGDRYPEAQDEIGNKVEQGVLLLNYVGHGGEVGWASERILEVNDVRSYENLDRLNVMMTVTCEFSRIDDPGRVSAGEYALLNPNGCSVALFSTMRVVFVGPANYLNRLFYNYAFEKDTDGDYFTFGEIMRFTKNASGTTSDRRKFGLLGDPAMQFHRPEYSVAISSVNGEPLNSFNDTLSALSLVSVSGIVQNESGQKATDFNGALSATVFDKYTDLQTLDNSGVAAPIPFELQKNVIYKGKATVVNGDWSYQFIVPIDIAYQIDYGKFSHYANQGLIDAAGSYREVYIGGTSDNPITDSEGPRIDLYMNDDQFVFGGITNEDPDIYAVLFDSLGINTVGNGIGHDLIAILDKESNNPIVLNDFYEADLNSFKRGTVRYPLSRIAPGRHHLYMKAWDVANNSAEAETEFVVAESADLALNHVLNYPNPFTTYTEFHFEHNRPAEPLEVQVQIFTVSGKLVKTLNTTVTTDGFRANPITWDGLDEYGDEIGRGVYVYRLKVRSMADNSADEEYEKLVILR